MLDSRHVMLLRHTAIANPALFLSHIADLLGAGVETSVHGKVSHKALRVIRSTRNNIGFHLQSAILANAKIRQEFDGIKPSEVAKRTRRRRQLAGQCTDIIINAIKVGQIDDLLQKLGISKVSDQSISTKTAENWNRRQLQDFATVLISRPVTVKLKQEPIPYIEITLTSKEWPHNDVGQTVKAAKTMLRDVRKELPPEHPFNCGLVRIVAANNLG